jgi:arginine deiminase
VIYEQQVIEMVLFKKINLLDKNVNESSTYIHYSGEFVGKPISNVFFGRNCQSYLSLDLP